MTYLLYLFYFAIAAVIGGHFFFAYSQWFKWPRLCEKVTYLEGPEIEKTAFLGRSFASYNASIGLGLTLSFKFEDDSQVWVQGVTLALIAVTAAVGASGSKGTLIRNFRLFPAIVALALLLVVRFSA